MVIGYARVSTIDQDLGRQVKALLDVGCERVYEDKVSGMSERRGELDRMLSELRSGDVVVVQKLDRLGRSLRHLIELIMGFKDKGVGFRVVDGSIDTTTPQGILLFHLMGAFAEFERNMISERVKDGLAYRRAQGVRLGRPAKNRGELFEKFSELRDAGVDRDGIMAALGISLAKYYALGKLMACVYLVQWEDTDLYKIGRTTNMEGRLTSLNTSMPTGRLVLYKKYAVGNPKHVERHLHKMFEDNRVNGEWFRLDKCDLELIEKAVPLLQRKVVAEDVPARLQAAYDHAKKIV